MTSQPPQPVNASGSFGGSNSGCRAERQEPAGYLLRLYVAGISPRSTQAITNIRRICEQRLKGRYDLEVIDIYQQPALAQSADIVAVPTLIKRRPPPLRRLVGSLADADRVLAGLDLLPEATA